MISNKMENYVVFKTIEEKMELQRLYYTGLSISKISKIYKCSPTTISKALTHVGTIKRKHGYHVLKYHYNINYFDDIDTEGKAFFFGLLFSDGNVGEKRDMIEIQLQLRDIHILEEFKKCIESDRPLRFMNRITKLGKESKLVDLEIYNKHVKETLISYGMIPRKSLVKKFPQVILDSSEEIQRHFIRGYFCGNGSLKGGYSRVNKDILTNSSFKITSTYDMCYNFKNLVYDYTGVECRIEPCRNVFNVITHTMMGSYMVSKWLFENSNYYINRKYELYKKLEHSLKFKNLI